jgi:lysophospholipid hydrolase
VAEIFGDSCLQKYLKACISRNKFSNFRQADFGLMHWLNGHEEQYSLVIYECDYAVTNWTCRCLRQADAIFVVANGYETPPEQHYVL